jgi:hypothetical protein
VNCFTKLTGLPHNRLATRFRLPSLGPQGRPYVSPGQRGQRPGTSCLLGRASTKRKRVFLRREFTRLRVVLVFSVPAFLLRIGSRLPNRLVQSEST